MCSNRESPEPRNRADIELTSAVNSKKRVSWAPCVPSVGVAIFVTGGPLVGRISFDSSCFHGPNHSEGASNVSSSSLQIACFWSFSRSHKPYLFLGYFSCSRRRLRRVMWKMAEVMCFAWKSWAPTLPVVPGLKPSCWWCWGSILSRKPVWGICGNAPEGLPVTLEFAAL